MNNRRKSDKKNKDNIKTDKIESDTTNKDNTNKNKDNIISIDWLFRNISEINTDNLSKLNIQSELELLKMEINNKELNRLKIIFIIEILMKTIKKNADYRVMIDLLINLLDTYSSISHIIFRLRIIKNISDNHRFYVPVYYFILEILSQVVNSRDNKESTENMSYDTLYLKNDTIDSVFILKEVKSLILSNLNRVSDNLGFVEISNVIVNELKKSGKGVYKEYVEGIINIINEHKEYITKHRNIKNKEEIRKMIK
ncbi:hypothetical protein P3W45_000951 [Vairimorpha bombi]|jgi:galactitol-specific phosphotransferase system IIB component